MFIFLLFIFFVSACRTEMAVSVGQNTASQSIVTTSNSPALPKTSIANSPAKAALSGEITGCTPEKFERGAKLVVSLKTPNGGYLAIEREGKNPDYFLLSLPENSDEQQTAAAADALPVWTTETLKNLPRIELDSGAARGVSLSKLNKQGQGKAELIFGKSGWYKISLSDENFEQDDPTITGQCRVYFDQTVTVQNAGQNPTAAVDKTIAWKMTEKNLDFQMQLRLSSGGPTAFFLEGSRQFTKNAAETANECEFAVEKGRNDSIWQTVGGRTTITGKNDSGEDFKMYIEKTANGFLIDTSAAAKSCFNVGMPGNVLLTGAGKNYKGKFTAFR